LIYEFDEFQFEPGNARLSRRGVLLHAEPKAMQVLEVLLDSHGSLVDRDTLLNLVWGRVIVTPGTLTRLIAELRRVLGDDPLKPRFIETIHTKGYRWIAAVASAKRTVSRSGPPERSIELIGRDEDLTQLQVIAATSRLLTLAGPGGTGKTQLALELARRRESQQPNSVVWIDLTAASDERALPGLITTALDVQLPDGAAGDEAERLVKRQPGRGRVQHDGTVAQAVEGGGGEAAAQAAALRRGGNGDQADSAERPSDGGAAERAVEIGGDAAAEARHERPIGQPMRPAEDGGQRMGSWQVGVGEGAEVGHIIPGTARSVPSIRRE
jgi:DNA-binding winged helix-turn-helix (wHTH) protein